MGFACQVPDHCFAFSLHNLMRLIPVRSAMEFTHSVAPDYILLICLNIIS